MNYYTESELLQKIDYAKNFTPHKVEYYTNILNEIRANMEKYKNQKTCRIIGKGEYNMNLVGQTGVIVKVMEYGVNVFINRFPTLGYTDNIFFFQYSEII